jgi:hypothetical protein
MAVVAMAAVAGLTAEAVPMEAVVVASTEEADTPVVAECEPPAASAVAALLPIEAGAPMAGPAGTPLDVPVASPAVPAA